MNPRALVLCAGHGTRLGALTASTPKPLLNAGGRPLLGWILAHLRTCGVREVAVNLHFQAGQFPAVIGDGSAYGVAVRWLPEEALFGTAGSLRRAGAWLAEQGPFLVCYGDVVTDHPLDALLRDLAGHPPALATMLLHRRASNSAIALDQQGAVGAFLERPDDAQRRAHGLEGETWVNSGICACSPALLERIPDGDPCDLPRQVLAPLAGTGLLRGQALDGRRVAVDAPERLHALGQSLAAGQWRFSPA